MRDLHYTLTLLSSGEAVLDLAAVKSHLRVDSTDEDAYLNALITIAQGMVDGRDGHLGRALLTQQWRLQQESFARYQCYPGGVYPVGYEGGAATDAWSPWNFRRGLEIRVPLPPLKTIDSIKYLDTSYNIQTLDPSVYRVVQGGGSLSSVIPKAGSMWPATAVEPDAVTIDFTCGYDSVDALNAERPGISQAMLLLIGLWYENREAALVAARAAAVSLPFAVEALLAPHRVRWL